MGALSWAGVNVGHAIASAVNSGTETAKNTGGKFGDTAGNIIAGKATQ
jgi:hypothetical protein